MNKARRRQKAGPAALISAAIFFSARFASASLTLSGASQETVGAPVLSPETLEKTDAGAILLEANNTFSGAITLSPGVLQLSGSAASIALGGTLHLTSDALTKIGEGSLGLNGNGALTYAITVNSSPLQLSVGDTPADSAGTVLLAPGALIKATSGTLTLAGNGATTSALTLNSGSLQLSSDCVLCGPAGLGGTLLLTPGTLSKTGSGTLTLTGNNTTNGVITVNSGTLQLSGGAVLAGSGGTLLLTPGTVAKTGSGTLTLTGNNTTNGVITVNSGSIQLSGGVGPAGSGGTLLLTSGTLTKTGSGTLTLTGNNTPNGVITVKPGSIQLSGTGTAGTVGNQQLSSGTVASNSVKTGTSSAGSNASTFKLTVAPGPNGAILPAGNLTIPKGASKAVTIKPASGYTIAQVIVDGVNKGAITNFIFEDVKANHSVSATFAPLYTLTASAGPNGTITPNGKAPVAKGAAKVYLIKPASGYVVSQVTVDGVNKGAITSYNFNNVSGDHTISATFAAKPAAPSTTKTQAKATLAGGKTVNVNALLGWQNTGVDVLKGQDLTIVATGKGTVPSGGTLQAAIVPSGGTALQNPFFAVDDDYKASVKTSGRLWLRLNSGVPALQTKAGTLTVEINASPKGD
jgi:autotransporter-associated beta strand protein